MDWQDAKALQDQGLITVQKHPDIDLWLLNYTQKCQYDGLWTDETMMCRGLIVDGDFTIKARPFKKFFTLEQHEALNLPALPWDKPYSIQEKMDGSLGILYWMGEYGKSEPRIATRGSFTSDQAIKANEMLRKISIPYTDLFNDGHTYLFEIIYPENRIVVDYGQYEILILLAIIETHSGQEVRLNHPYFMTPRKYPHFTSDKDQKAQLLSLVKNDGTEEGLVVRFEDNTRIKIKTEEYLRLHRLMTEFSSKSIWELLRAGSSFDEILEKVPDEFYQWVKETKADLEKGHEKIMTGATKVYDRVKDLPRKDAAFAIRVIRPLLAPIVFSLLDNKVDRANDAAWKMVKPIYQRPFRKDSDV